ncbi:hypothetical protein KKE06_00435 [Candidatus Micrarchaeota archaeon]|nr:hypothetical protein [Candidatus Micrarchaeota archaeon]MBU1929996.1 hypothetical protein [Candidatus Micrarchaeota archaeon]
MSSSIKKETVPLIVITFVIGVLFGLILTSGMNSIGQALLNPKDLTTEIMDEDLTTPTMDQCLAECETDWLYCNGIAFTRYSVCMGIAGSQFSDCSFDCHTTYGWPPEEDYPYYPPGHPGEACMDSCAQDQTDARFKCFDDSDVDLDLCQLTKDVCEDNCEKSSLGGDAESQET